MRKWILIFTLYLLVLPHVSGQNQVGCVQLLEDAKEAYQAGMVELVPELLNACLEEGGLAGETKQEAYVLVISAYIFDYLPDEADAMMVKFLDEFPEYQTKATDPSEFTILLASHKQQRTSDATFQAAQDEAREQQEAERRAQEAQEAQRKMEEQARLEQQRKQREKEAKARARAQRMEDMAPALGFHLGTGFSMPQSLEPYSLTNPEEMVSSYGMGSVGMAFGLSFFLPLSRSLDLGIEAQYSMLRFNYESTPLSFTSYVYDEYHSRITLPLSLAINLNPDGGTKFYLRMGLVPDYLLSAQASAVRSYASTGSAFPDVELEKSDILASRNRFNLSGLGGLGVKVPLNMGLFFAEARYHYGFLQCNVPEERYGNGDLTWLIYHVDNDFRLHHLDILAGLVFNLK
jgi:hypothetical protein